MVQRIFLQTVLAVVLAGSFSTGSFAQEKPRLDFKPGEVIVGYQTPADRRASETRLKSRSIANSFSLLGGQKTQTIDVKTIKDTTLLIKFTLPTGQNAFASDDAAFQRRLIDDLAGQIKKADPKVKYVYPNYLMKIPESKSPGVNESQLKKQLSALTLSAAPPNSFPDDPQFAAGLQWNFQALPRGMNALGAWKVTTGDRKIVVAVVDSGILRSHPDVVGAGNLLPGYNFVSDGSGRSDDPTDKLNIFHGSHVASIIGAVATNNKLHMAGVNWAVSILPVRVVNEAGGISEKDMADAILWAAGITVDGVPKNETPADVINVSIEQEVPCSEIAIVRDAIEKARAAGAVIVAAAGNSAKDVAGITPAGCAGVISVGAATVKGRLASYSNFGNVSIVAPGGDSRLPVLGISERGTVAYSGTSFAAPHVAAAIALALSNHEQWRRNPDLIAAAIRETATPMVAGACPRSCGPGQLDALRLLEYQPASITPPAVAAASSRPSSTSTPAKPKVASASEFSGRWQTLQNEIIFIHGDDWMHSTRGVGEMSRPSPGELVVRYPHRMGVICTYRATLLEDGRALRLDPLNASQPSDFCPSGRLSSITREAAVQSKASAKAASETSQPSIVGRWLMAGSGILVIEQGGWVHPVKGTADFVSFSDDRLVVQYPQPASAQCAYRIIFSDGGRVVELIATNALQSDDFCPSGRLTAVR